MKAIITLCILFVAAFGLQVSDIVAQSSQTGTDGFVGLPKVFKLGEYNYQYEGMMPGFQTLLEACDGDMQVAHKKLYSMMKEMEAFANVMEYDLNGVKAWMHFFFKKDGTIEHIGFHLKPTSKNIDTTEFNTFLKNFTKQYKFPINTSLQFSHYSSFSFPVF